MHGTGKKDSSDKHIASIRLFDKEYNELYRKWQIEHKSDYGFYFAGRSDVLTYRKGEGFITESPKSAERNAVIETHTLIARFVSIYVLLCLAVWASVEILSLTVENFGIFYESGGFFSGSSEPAVLAFSYIVNIAKRVLPMFYILGEAKMPAKVFLPTRIRNKPLFNSAAPMAMLIFAVCTMCAGANNALFGFFGINMSEWIWLPESKVCLVLSALLQAVVIPVISEIVHHGIILQIFRQFGDGHALIMSSLIAALSTGDFGSFFFFFVISAVIGYFTMRSGSILTAFVMRIVISSSSYLLTYIKTSPLIIFDYLTVSMAMVFLYLITGLIFLALFMKNYSNKINLPFYEMYMGSFERALCVMTNPSVIVLMSLCFVFAAANT